jgi:hypothetical protein
MLRWLVLALALSGCDGTSGGADAGGVPPTCGNGELDEGEACDGTACCVNCQIAPAGAVCRSESDPCDAEETCDGASQECPADRRVAREAPVVLEPVSLGGGTYPRATTLADGSLMAVRESAAGGQFRLVTSRSDDGGRSWVEGGVVASEPTTPGRSLANPHLVQLADGTLLVGFRHHDPAAGGGTNFRLLVSASSDLGASWTFRGEIEVFTSNDVGLWEPFLLVTPAGVLQAYYARERNGNAAQDILVRDSSDAGASWGAPRIVATAAGSRDGMPGVAALGDGSLVAVFEAFRQPGVNNRFVVRAVQSTDGGLTWGNRHLVFAPADPNRHAGAPQIATLADGRLVVSFMTDDGEATTAWPGGAATRVILSSGVPTAGTLAWATETITVAPPASYWPGLADGTRDPLVLYAGGGAVATSVCLP